MAKTIIYAAVSAFILIMLAYYFTRKRRLRGFFSGSFTGLAALFILNRFGGAFETRLPLNAFNLCGSFILGTPFVICEVILKIL